MTSLKFIVFFLIFIIAVHALALVNYWYWTYQWLDIPMHFLGGFWVAMVFFWLRGSTSQILSQIREEVEPRKIKIVIIVVSCLSFVALIGVLWEFVEFLYDVFISSRGYSGFLQLGAADTIADLFFDILGGFVFIVIYRVFKPLSPRV